MPCPYTGAGAMVDARRPEVRTRSWRGGRQALISVGRAGLSSVMSPLLPQTHRPLVYTNGLVVPWNAVKTESNSASSPAGCRVARWIAPSTPVSWAVSHGTSARSPITASAPNSVTVLAASSPRTTART